MKGNGKKNKKLNIAAFFKKNGFSLFMVMISLFSLVTLTTAWLKRTTDAEPIVGPGFKLTNNLTVIPNECSVETYYLASDNTWKLITRDYVRNDEITKNIKNWEEFWDENSAILVPGKRTEFKTVLTNLTDKAITASTYLTDVSIEDELKNKVKIGVYEPELKEFEGSNEDLFSPMTDSEGRKWVWIEAINIARDMVIQARKSGTVRWYAYISTDVSGGSFPALTDMSGNFIIDESLGTTCYFFVNDYDSDGNPTEAFMCNSKGELVKNDNKLIGYRENDAADPDVNVYESTEYKDFTFGNVAAKVRVSGLYIAVG